MLSGQCFNHFPQIHDLQEVTEDIVVKGENAGDQNFLLIQQCFSTLPRSNLNLSVTFILMSANALNSDQSKILSFGKALNGQCPEYYVLRAQRLTN